MRAESCEDYCVELGSCSDEMEVDMQSCMDNCTDALKQCQEDELDEAVAVLDTCVAADACDEVIECTWEVSTECYFGL